MDYQMMKLPKSKMVHKMWRQDFSRSEWSLSHHPPEHFTRCFWQKSEKVLVWWIIYRTLLAVYFLVTWITSIFNLGRGQGEEEDVNKYWIFLTNWSYILETMYFLLAFVIVVAKAMEEEKEDSAEENRMAFMPWHYKLCWALQNTVLPASVVVTCIFWGAVYKPEIDPLDYLNITTHVFNSVLIVIDFFLVAQPFKILHFYCPAIYSVAYLVFSLIYQLSGGKGTKGRLYIYEILDWYKPVPTIITCVLAIIFLIIVHVLFWLLHKVKKCITLKMEKRRARKYEGGHENLGMDIRPPV